MLVARFLDWVETAPAARRAEAIGLLGRAWLYSDLSDEEGDAAEAALTVMLDDGSVRVRRAMADALCRDPRSPSHIILALAQDHAEVAEIVLGASPVLLDEDLIDIAAGASPRLLNAIASRPWISTPLCAALAEIGDRTACARLAANAGADATAAVLRRIAERHGGDAAVREALAMRHDCPADVRQILVGKVTEALGGSKLVRATIADDRLSRILREAGDKATVALSISMAPGELGALTDHLRVSGQLTPSLLLRALCTGNVRLFEQAITTLSGLPAARVATILADPGSKPFLALLERAGLPPATWAVFAAGSDLFRQLVGEGQDANVYGFSRLLLDTVLRAGIDAADEDVRPMLALLRRFAAESARDAIRAMRADAQLAA